jgi:hypothetical protein
MSARLDVEDVQTTKGEKLLAVVLTVFLLIGGIWAYVKTDDWVRTTTPPDYSYKGTPAEQAAIGREERAATKVARAERTARLAERRLELDREAYRTALEANRPEAERLGHVYDRSQARLSRAERAVVAAQGDLRRAGPAAEAAHRHIGEVQTGRVNHRELVTFFVRLAFVLANVVFGYYLLSRLRRRASRFYPLSLAFVGYAAILAFVMSADYITDYIDPLDWSPLILSLFGIAVTLLAFLGLQRYLARRIPQRRVRKRECPFCGYPVRGNEHCEGCGREIVASCARCNEPRRVGTSFCGACGAA